ncbi:hypothetical protein AGLY_008785 [Aphis glycines]|uniref:Uncharacterized protein n=1 Tax=Aphis glycines TaxID=307491 RepID=A0A6G0TJQ9_APHGL|nr:hypothetical protein AGLY_008785 [Aphis glycines]
MYQRWISKDMIRYENIMILEICQCTVIFQLAYSSIIWRTQQGVSGGDRVTRSSLQDDGRLYTFEQSEYTTVYAVYSKKILLVPRRFLCPHLAEPHNFLMFWIFKIQYRIPLCCTLDAMWITITYYYMSVKFESNDMVGETGGLCFNGLNTPKEELMRNFVINLQLFRLDHKNFIDTSKKNQKFQSIYDFYFLNNNKYLKSFEAKPLFNAVLKIYGEPCTKFSKLSYKRKNFMIFQPQNYLQIFAILTYFKPCIKFSRFSGQPKNFYRYLKKKYLEKLKISIFKKSQKYKHFVKISIFELQPYKKTICRKLVLRKNSRFSVIFFFVFLDFFENCWKMLTFTSIMHQEYSLLHRKPPHRFRTIIYLRRRRFIAYNRQFKTIQNIAQNTFEVARNLETKSAPYLRDNCSLIQDFKSIMNCNQK